MTNIVTSGKICGIYMLRRDGTDQCYVGQSIDIIRRKTSHFRTLRENKHRSVYLQRAYNKYGEGSFSFFVLESGLNPSDKDQLVRAEQQWMDSLNSCYNVAPAASGGGSALKGRPSSFRGKSHSEEANEKNRCAHLGKPSPRKGKPGKPHSVETRMKMSVSQLGKHSSKRQAWSTEAKARHSLIIKNMWAFRKQKEMSA